MIDGLCPLKQSATFFKTGNKFSSSYLKIIPMPLSNNFFVLLSNKCTCKTASTSSESETTTYKTSERKIQSEQYTPNREKDSQRWGTLTQFANYQFSNQMMEIVMLKNWFFSFQPDVNECLIDAPNCTHGTSCINTLGGYQCVCIGGRYGANCQYGEYSSCRDK